MLLHDLRMLFDEPRVLNQALTPREMSPEFLVTLHELWVERSTLEPFVKLEFPWSLPTWDTFFDFAISTTQWRAAIQEAAMALFSCNTIPDINFIKTRFRFLQAAWVDSICSAAGMKRGQWDWSESYINSRLHAVRAEVSYNVAGEGQPIAALEVRTSRRPSGRWVSLMMRS